MTARDVWRWTDERGVQRLVGTDELRAALASAILPATTLVWREGMKEWAPASTLPELASAAFAGGASPVKIEKYDGRNTLQERERRATLVGLPTPSEAALADVKMAVAVPAVPTAFAKGDRPPVTQVPPFGGPPLEAVVPLAPRVPAPPLPSTDKAKPKRKITTSELDGMWATTTHSDEDDTIPRRARPSELAAAAAAAADATAALRDARGRTRTDPDARKPTPPPLPGRKPPPPLPSASARLEARESVAPKDGSPEAGRPQPPPKPPARPKSIPPPPPPKRAIASAAVPMKPVVPSVRIKPPDHAPDSIEDLAGDAKAAPFKMGAHGAQAFNATLTGVPAAVVPAGSGAPEKPMILRGPAASGPPARPPTRDSGAAPAPQPLTAAEASKVTKTLVSPRESVDSIPGLAAAIAVADDPSDTAVLPSTGAPVARPLEEVTQPGDWPLAGPALEPAVSNGKGHAPAATGEGDPPKLSTQPMEAMPLPPPRQAHPSRPPPARSQPSYPPAASPHAELTPPPARAELVSGSAFTEPPPQGAEGVVSRSAMLSMPPLADDAGMPRGRLDEQIAVPLSSLVGAGGLLIGLVIVAFFMGRASSVSVPRLTAHPVLGAVPQVARAALPAPPKPCWMAKQPAMWAPHASRVIPFDAVATHGGNLAIGYAHDARQAMGIEVDLATGEVRSRLDDKAREEIERVVPMPNVEFRVARTGTGGPLRTPIDVFVGDGPQAGPDGGARATAAGLDGGGGTAFAVGLADGGIALASPPEGTPAALWPLSGDEGIGAATVHPAGARGFALLFRRGGAVWGGFIGADHHAVGDLVKVAGSGGSVGKPAAGWNGREVAVIFADRPEADGLYDIRVGHGPPGAIPATTTVLPLPRGGPGGDAFAPDIAGLSDGRWLLMWTEGGSGARAVRAQTLAPDFSPLGDPIALSPPAGNFGQGVIGVVGDHAATVFLSKGASSYELWGAVLQCGG